MRESLLSLLADPISKGPLRLTACGRKQGGDIIEGTLQSPGGQVYEVTNGIPRLVASIDAGQTQTAESFGYKWRQRATYDSPGMHETGRAWLASRYGFAGIDQMRAFFGRRRRILDAGCGSGLTSSFWMDEHWSRDHATEWFGVDISRAIDVARERLGAVPGTHFVQADVLQLPFRPRSFDAVYSEGVMHHTPSTERAFKSLASCLEPNGEFLFYVYRKKAPVREFTDDHVREALSGLEPADAWNRLRPLTKLAQALADSKVEVEVAEDVPYLGIRAGRYPVQRLLYWHFAKLYWNDRLSFEENNHVNFDWYHPRYAHRHTEEDVRRWCKDCRLTIVHFDAQESGFTVRAVNEEQ